MGCTTKQEIITVTTEIEQPAVSRKEWEDLRVNYIILKDRAIIDADIFGKLLVMNDEKTTYIRKLEISHDSVKRQIANAKKVSK